MRTPKIPGKITNKFKFELGAKVKIIKADHHMLDIHNGKIGIITCRIELMSLTTGEYHENQYEVAPIDEVLQKTGNYSIVCALESGLEATQDSDSWFINWIEGNKDNEQT